MKCLACGGESMVGGTALDNSDGGEIAFRPDETPTWKKVLGVGTRAIRALGCVHCGHLQLAVDFTEKDLQRYQQFEGEQPGVIERINSEPQKLEE